jgi:hypothetical protein
MLAAKAPHTTAKDQFLKRASKSEIISGLLGGL